MLNIVDQNVYSNCHKTIGRRFFNCVHLRNYVISVHLCPETVRVYGGKETWQASNQKQQGLNVPES